MHASEFYCFGVFHILFKNFDLPLLDPIECNWHFIKKTNRYGDFHVYLWWASNTFEA